MRKLTKITKNYNATMPPLLWLLRLAPLIFVLSQLSRLSKESSLFTPEEECPECGDSTTTTTTTRKTTAITAEEDTRIREWGCNRQEAPFIFVHIGKAGGGSVRARLAAAALDYKRPAWNMVGRDKTYYYPMLDRHDNTTQHRGQFFSSQVHNYVPDFADAYRGDFLFEGMVPCAAKTPLGAAIACPKTLSQQCEQHNCEFDYVVFAGHNLLYSELHWLPEEYLIEWWNRAAANLPPKNAKLAAVIADLLRDRNEAIDGTWSLPQEATEILNRHQMHVPSLKCPQGPVAGKRVYKPNYKHCYQPKEAVVDLLAQEIIGTNPLLHAQLLTLLPVLRVTVLREPFGWLMSKYFWHEAHPHWNQTTQSVVQISPDKGAKANREQRIRNERANKPPPPPFIACDDISEAAIGWAAYRARTYMAYLCGDFCLANPNLPLAEMERQAAYNLRNAFAVVGLLQEEESFYQMVSQRVAYMDTSLNPDVEGKKHPSGMWGEAQRCKKVYQNASFQHALMEESPEVAALYRLYKIGVQVNQFQKQELEQCSDTKTTVS